MNIEICKKCQKAKTVHFSLDFSFFPNKGLTIYFSTDDNPVCIYAKYNNKKDVRKIIGKSNSYISKFMEIEKSCPYYMEHQLTDWNRKINRS